MNEKEQILSLVKSDEWPRAVDPDMICDLNSEEDKQSRAEGILEMLPVVNGKFLDFGCGEGHLARLIKSETKRAIGYDIESFPTWDEDQTTNWKMVLDNGPYDLILVYDVLDHCGDPVAALKQIKQAKAPKGQIFIRFHPWAGRHGGHLYHTINKAYAHLILTEDEIEELRATAPPVNRIIHPIATYKSWIKEALSITTNHAEGYDITEEPAEDFFKETPIIRKRLASTYAKSPVYKDGSFPSNPLKHSFADRWI